MKIIRHGTTMEFDGPVTKCWNGHLMVNGNVYESRGKRRCRQCRLRWEKIKKFRIKPPSIYAR